MELNQAKAALEAVLFAHGEPLSTERLAAILEVEEPTVERLLLALKDECDKPHRGVALIRLEDAWQLATKPEQGEVVKRALDTRRNAPLSQAALEVLSIIAYNQPVSRSFVEQVRGGVDSSGVIAGLVEKGLVTEGGRLDLPGRPIAFQTTDAFLRVFGLTSLAELPSLHGDEEDEPQADELLAPEGFETRPAASAPMDGNPADDGPLEPPAETHALRGGEFIEGDKGQAVLAGEEE